VVDGEEVREMREKTEMVMLETYTIDESK